MNDADLSIILILSMPCVVAYPLAFQFTIEDLLSIYPQKLQHKDFVRALLLPRTEIMVRLAAAAAVLSFIAGFFTQPSLAAFLLALSILVLMTWLFYVLLRDHFLKRIKRALRLKQELYRTILEVEFERVAGECLEIMEGWRSLQKSRRPFWLHL